MNLQHFFAMSFGLSVEHVYYIAIAILACILGAEIAGICMLVGKLRRARGGEIDLPNDEYDDNGGANYAMAALSFGAVSATAELALFVLAIAAAVGALVLCLLLVVCYAKGYLLISAKAAKAAVEAEQAAKQALQEAAEAAEAEAAEEELSYGEEEQIEEAYDEDVYADSYDDDEEALEAISNLIATEDAVMSEEYEEEVVEAVEETVEEEQDALEVAAVEEEPEVSVVQTVEHTVITEGTPAYAGQAPVVEKHIIETTREIIKETNTTTVTEGKGEQFSPATEEMMKAITEFMKLETQLRMEREVAVERPTEDGESAPAFADTEDEELEADEIDTEDEVEAEDEAEREADAEENDDEYESDLFGNERIVGFDEETGCYIIARYRKSCEAKLMQSRPTTKKYYSAIRNALMGYEGTKERMSWTIDTYTNEHTQIAKINVRPRTLDLYLALEPSTLEDSVYRGRDVGSKKKYAETPFLYKVNSPRKLTLALELVQRACEEQGLSPIDIEEVNYEEQYPFTDTETLVARGLIREYLREEKPAATFELDPDHVPQLVEEDETVIPANANFTWEFDNDQPVVEEPVVEEIIEEPIEEEPVVEEEPTIEEESVEEEVTAAPGTTTTTTTTHETIRTTERHYTERYYGTDTEAEVSEETRTIEVLPEPAQEIVETEAEEILPEDEEPAEEVLAEEEVLEVAEEVEEEIEDEIIDDEIIEDDAEEDYEETTDEQAAQIQSAVAALFGDDIFEEDEPVEEEPVEDESVEETIEEELAEEEITEEEIIEDESEEILEETVEECTEEIEEIEEEIIEEEPEAEEVIYEEEYYEEEPEAEAVIYEEEYSEEETEDEDVIYEEEYYEEETEDEDVIYEEEYYEEDSESEEVVYEEEYYEDENEEVYEDVEGEEFEEIYEEEVEEIEEEEEPAPAPAPVQQPASDVVLLDVCVFDDYFDNGAIVNLETLKQVGLAPEGATRLKVYASGSLKGQFTVEANHFTLDAIKAIGDADGDSIMIR